MSTKASPVHSKKNKGNAGQRSEHVGPSPGRKTLFQVAPVGYFVFNDEGIIIDVNPAGARLLGMQKDGLIGSGISSFIDPADRDIFSLHFQEALTREAGVMTDLTLRDSAGKPFIAHLQSVLTTAGDGNKQVRTTVSDITGRKQAEEALRKSHDELEQKVKERTEELTKAYELLRTIFASITVHIVYMDCEFNIISVNRAYAEAEGREAQFFLGRNYFALSPDAETKALFSRVVETGEPQNVYEKRFVSARHPERDVTYRDWSLQPVKDANGRVRGLLVSSIDVTDRKRAEENNLRLATAIQSAADAVVITDVRGIIQYVNPAFEKITGFCKEEALGRDQHILDGGRHDQVFFSALRQTLHRDGFWKGRLINKKKDGTIYQEECTYSPIRNSSGEIINYVSIKRDVTEKLWLESIAQSVDTMNNIGYIFAGVRHEIGNPVNAVHMILEVLKSKLSSLDKPAIEGYLDRALGELSRVEYLLRTLKNYNMYERPHLQNIRLKEFMEKFLSVVREDFRIKGIAVTVAVEEQAECCHADARALHQILLNCLTNAADALEGRDRPAIAIQAFKKGGMIRIRIEDNGSGMTEEEINAVFKPFYTTKPKGTGLGLVIVRKMLAMMRGSIEITSRKNTGTIVDLSLREGAHMNAPDITVKGSVHEEERGENHTHRG